MQGGGPEDVKALREELAELRKLVTEKVPVSNKEKARKALTAKELLAKGFIPESEWVSLTAACGRAFKKMTEKRAAAAIRMHKRHCKVCQDAEAKE